MDFAILDGILINNMMEFNEIFDLRSNCDGIYKFTSRCGNFLNLVTKPF